MAQGAQLASASEADALSEHVSSAGAEHRRIPLRQLIAPVLAPAVDQAAVPLLSSPDVGAVADGEPLPEINWSAAIQLIRDMGTRMRRTRKAAQENAERSHALAQQSLRKVEVAERRERAAEAAAKAALLRAAWAEAAAEAAETRARRAEEEMQAAQAERAEAQMWLRSLYSCVLAEFEGLTEAPR
ncbi:hypothetical protein [uncultured Methylobacterium sp.]|uniref:hypothetical protein n=1 Tax=uncultured Methylobacterium sp. TaxID=157278 RepID=UPI002598D229|nr:hypothetical protein [uncultured Methylobacterium sp.]